MIATSLVMSRTLPLLRSDQVIPGQAVHTSPSVMEATQVAVESARPLAAGRWPGLWPVLATLIGGSLSAGGANALNNYVDRDIDQIMKRTRSRPLARHEVPPSSALVLGIALGVAGFVWLWVTTNLLAAAIATAALASRTGSS